MAKVATKVDQERLVASIEKVEAGGALKNQNKLFVAAADDYNTGLPASLKPISFSVVGLRIAEWKLSIKTPKGKRGRSGGNPEAIRAMHEARANAPRRSRKEKLAGHPDAAKNSKHMREMLTINGKEGLLPIVERVEAGSLTARIKLNCLQCMGYDAKSVKNCGDYGCPFFLVRPYQKSEESDLENGVPVEADEAEVAETAEAA